jgi:hypothetical protein
VLAQEAIGAPAPARPTTRREPAPGRPHRPEERPTRHADMPAPKSGSPPLQSSAWHAARTRVLRPAAHAIIPQGGPVCLPTRPETGNLDPGPRPPPPMSMPAMVGAGKGTPPWGRIPFSFLNLELFGPQGRLFFAFGSGFCHGHVHGRPARPPPTAAGPRASHY